MLRALFALIGLWSISAFAANCDCQVTVYPPMTGSVNIGTTIFKHYKLESFDSLKVKNQLQCRTSCLSRFEEDFPSERLNSLLAGHSKNLISQGVLGYNCTGLTTLKYPVRVHAKLGKLGLGNVADHVQVVSVEKICFNF